MFGLGFGIWNLEFGDCLFRRGEMGKENVTAALFLSFLSLALICSTYCLITSKLSTACEDSILESHLYGNLSRHLKCILSGDNNGDEMHLYPVYSEEAI